MFFLGFAAGSGMFDIISKQSWGILGHLGMPLFANIAVFNIVQKGGGGVNPILNKTKLG